MKFRNKLKMSTDISQVEKFHKVIGEFFNAIQIVIYNLNNEKKTTLNTEDVDIVKKFVLALDKNYLIKNFIENTNGYWDTILKRDDDYFVEHSNDIFGEYNNDSRFLALKIIFSKDSSGKYIVDAESKD